MFLLQMLNAYKTALYQSSSSSIASLQLIKEREPVGDLVHLFFACLFLFFTPINAVASSISFGLLLFYSLLRLHVTCRGLVQLLFHPIITLSIIFLAWSALSLLWSDGIENGLHHLRSMRIFLVPFMLWPIIPHWKWLMFSIVIGVLFLNVFQIIEMLEMYEANGKIARTSGIIGGHPPSVGLWCAASLLILTFFFRALRSWHLLIAFIAFALATVGLIASSGRGNFIGVLFSVLFYCFFNLSKIKQGKKYILHIIMIATVLFVIIWKTPAGTFLESRINQAFHGLNSYVNNKDPRTSTGVRLAWWGSSMRAAQENPVVGVGLGGFPQWTLTDEELDFFSSKWPAFTQKTIIGATHPHSMYMSTLSEGGLIGSALLFSLIATSLICCWKVKSAVSSGGVICTLLMLWLIAGFFDSFQYSSQTLCLFSITITVAIYISCLVKSPN